MTHWQYRYNFNIGEVMAARLENDKNTGADFCFQDAHCVHAAGLAALRGVAHVAAGCTES